MATNYAAIPRGDYSSEEEEEETEESNLEVELTNFRQQWQAELIGSSNRASTDNARTGRRSRNNSQNEDPEILEKEAKYLFLQGVNAEKNGTLYEAIRYYRQAVQLVPDIEFKIKDYVVSIPSAASALAKNEGNEEISSPDEKLDNLSKDLQEMCISGMKHHCESARPQTSTHISSLPVEVLMYIFRWVVSCELDMRSLEQLSLVCKGFYICARDSEIWKLAATRIWGVNCRLTKEHPSWRSVFIHRPHLRYCGVYISKSSYIRHGEQSLDMFYRPWHTVEYYRYIRVFPDGELEMLTSPNNPHIIIPKMKSKQAKLPGLLSGHYRIAGDKVIAVFHKIEFKVYDQALKRYKRHQNHTQLDYEQTFHVELTIEKVGGKSYSKLTWNGYSCRTNYKSTGQLSVAEFDLNCQHYPPFFFSRVKSYTANATSPLM
ncbi:F-box only protein 9-like [Saccoglossus kowalevskii]|uniref:F-box only protein 9-like n=1 Tax=Saccoglossus kowalevskii TaxID=10224 RepID=A0ABM0N1G3_SACKO|nr:PREDICTED: F-box only protein 9-like [Saccoglossus kowalevskii]